MKILITGASGFIGINLCQKLLQNNHQLLGIDNFYSSNEANLKVLAGYPDFQFKEANIINDFESILDGFTPEIIINLACPASPPRYQKDPIFTWETSVLGTRNCLKLAQKTGATLIHASTSEVYGNPSEHPQKESYWGHVNPVGIRSCYDEGKRAAETLLMDAHRQDIAKIKIFRIFNTYGPHMDPKDGRVVSNFIMQALQNKNLSIYGDGSQSRSFQYIDDLVAGIISFIESDNSFAGPVNLGNPDEFTIAELADAVLDLVPQITGKECTSQKEFRALPQDDPLQRCPNISLAKEQLNWEPKIKLIEGLRKTIPYFMEIPKKSL